MEKSHPIIAKKTRKEDREYRILLALVEHYIRNGKPVGSNTLKESGHEKMSAATIRNYFANLERDGYLEQPHTSGGRIPTDKAFRVYANEYLDARAITSAQQTALAELKETDAKEITPYLQRAAEILAKLTECAVFLTAPRFDQDLITLIKVVGIDTERLLCIVITDFGVVKTELFHTDLKLNSFVTHRLERYFHWRLTGNDKPEELTKKEEEWGKTIYNELIVRYLISYANFFDEEVYRTGLSNLLAYPELHDAATLSNCLALFENAHSMRLLLRDCTVKNQLKIWIGQDLKSYSTLTPECSVIGMPYRIGTQPVGGIGILGPMRLPYRELCGLLRLFSETVSETLTRNIYKYKITFRQPQAHSAQIKYTEENLMLLEDHSHKENT